MATPTKPQPPLFPFYAVVCIENLAMAYSGESLRHAAMALEPGTTFGAGHTALEARNQARARAVAILSLMQSLKQAGS